MQLVVQVYFGHNLICKNTHSMTCLSDTASRDLFTGQLIPSLHFLFNNLIIVPQNNYTIISNDTKQPIFIIKLQSFPTLHMPYLLDRLSLTQPTSKKGVSHLAYTPTYWTAPLWHCIYYCYGHGSSCWWPSAAFLTPQDCSVQWWCHDEYATDSPPVALDNPPICKHTTFVITVVDKSFSHCWHIFTYDYTVIEELAASHNL